MSHIDSAALSFVTFNRNILYCKFSSISIYSLVISYLIGTFCIVNVARLLREKMERQHLIGTFCIVNIYFMWGFMVRKYDLIGTFCIVNILGKTGKGNKAAI